MLTTQKRKFSTRGIKKHHDKNQKARIIGGSGGYDVSGATAQLSGEAVESLRGAGTGWELGRRGRAGAGECGDPWQSDRWGRGLGSLCEVVWTLFLTLIDEGRVHFTSPAPPNTVKSEMYVRSEIHL